METLWYVLKIAGIVAGLSFFLFIWRKFNLWGKIKNAWKKREEEKRSIEHKEKIYKKGSIDRMYFALFCWLILLATLTIIGKSFISQRYGDFIGIATWFFLLPYTLKHFMVSVPEVTGLITINLFRKGNLRPYGPGMHFNYPWEQVKEGNYINLRIITQERTETYPSEDGPVLKVKWSFQYRATILGLPKYIAVDETTIDKGFGDVGSSFLGAKISSQAAENSVGTRAYIEKELQKEFEKETYFENEGVKNLEELYGVNILRISLADIDYEEKYQKARSTKSVAQKLKETANNIQKDKKISDKDAFNAALIINGDVTKHIQEVEGEGGQALAALLMAMAKGKGG